MIPTPQELRGIPVNPDQLRAGIKGLEAELTLKACRLEAYQELKVAEAAWVQSMSEKNGCHFSAKTYVPAIQKFAESEVYLYQLELRKLEAEIMIKKKILEEAEQQVKPVLSM